MNFDPNLPTWIAISMGLFAPLLWGSWFITLKYLGDYPLEAFYITLFGTSMVIVWSGGFVLDGTGLTENLKMIWSSDPSRIYITFICGMLFVAGMQFTLRAIRILGLSISQPIQSSINVIGGTAVSAFIGGIPENLTLFRIALSVFFLLAAGLLTMTAGSLRNKDQQAENIETSHSRDPQQIKKAFLMFILSAFLTPAYIAGLSYGLKSVTQEAGLAVMPFMATMVSGAFLGALLISGTILTFRKQWHIFKTYSFKTHRLGMIAGIALYSGNIIHTFATRNLSAIVAWPLGVTSGLWTQIWGLVYGEFKGAPRISYLLLGAGVLCYITGAFIIANII